MEKLALFLIAHVLLKGSSQLIPIYIYIYIYIYTWFISDNTEPWGTPLLAWASLDVVPLPATHAAYLIEDCVSTHRLFYCNYHYRKVPNDLLHWSQSKQSEPVAHSPTHFAVYGTHMKTHYRCSDVSNKQTGCWKTLHCVTQTLGTKTSFTILVLWKPMGNDHLLCGCV